MDYGTVYSTVLSANMIKSRLDKFCENQDIIYDLNAQLQGSGN